MQGVDGMLAMYSQRTHTSAVGCCVGACCARRSSLSMCISVVLPALSSPCSARRINQRRQMDGAPATLGACSTYQEEDLGVFVVQAQLVQYTVKPVRCVNCGRLRWGLTGKAMPQSLPTS